MQSECSPSLRLPHSHRHCSARRTSRSSAPHYTAGRSPVGIRRRAELPAPFAMSRSSTKPARTSRVVRSREHHQALVADSSEIASPWKRVTACGGTWRVISSKRDERLAARLYFNGDSLEIPCSCCRHSRRLSAIRADVPAMSEARRQLDLGMRQYSRKDLEAAPRAGETIHNPGGVATEDQCG